MIKQLKQMVKSIADCVDTWIERKIVQALTLAPMETSSWHNQYSDYICQVQIKRCSDELYWYSRHIGDVFMVEAEDQDRFWVREDDEYRCLNFVMKKDVIVL